MGTKMACFCGCHDNKMEWVLDGNKSSGYHGNCNENVKCLILSTKAKGVLKTVGHPTFHFSLLFWFYTVFNSRIIINYAALQKLSWTELNWWMDQLSISTVLGKEVRVILHWTFMTRNRARHYQKWDISNKTVCPPSRNEQKYYQHCH